MKKLALSLLFCNCLIFSTLAQTDSLESAILSYQNSKVTLIQNGRAMLLDHFQNGDMDEVATVMHYLETEVESAEFMVFHEYEKWLLQFWTKQYYKLLLPFKNLSDSTVASLNFSPIPPPQDGLVHHLLESTITVYEYMQDQLDESFLSPEDRDFLKLFFDWTLHLGGALFIGEEQLNTASIAFVEKYPDSDFRYFVLHEINQEKTLSRFGMGFEFFSGFGTYKGGLKDFLGHHVPFGVAFDFYWKKWIFGFRDHIGIGKLDEDFIFDDGVWESGSRFNHFLIELSGAYEIYDSPRFKIYPFAGVTFSTVSPTEKDTRNTPNLDQAGLDWRTVFPTLGLNIDLKLNSPYTDNPRWKDGYGVVRLRAGYNPTNFQKKYTGYDGNTFYLTLGIGGVARKVVRKYK